MGIATILFLECSVLESYPLPVVAGPHPASHGELRIE
jgi:hypothetical protein